MGEYRTSFLTERNFKEGKINYTVMSEGDLEHCMRAAENLEAIDEVVSVRVKKSDTGFTCHQWSRPSISDSVSVNDYYEALGEINRLRGENKTLRHNIEQVTVSREYWKDKAHRAMESM